MWASSFTKMDVYLVCQLSFYASLSGPLETAVWCALGRTSPANALTPKPSTLPLQWPLLLRLRHRNLEVMVGCYKMRDLD
eukprot:UN06064